MTLAYKFSRRKLVLVPVDYTRSDFFHTSGYKGDK